MYIQDYSEFSGLGKSKRRPLRKVVKAAKKLRKVVKAAKKLERKVYKKLPKPLQKMAKLDPGVRMRMKKAEVKEEIQTLEKRIAEEKDPAKREELIRQLMEKKKKLAKLRKMEKRIAIVAAIVASFFIPGVSAVMAKGLALLKSGAVAAGKSLLVSTVVSAATQKGLSKPKAEQLGQEVADYAEKTGALPDEAWIQKRTEELLAQPDMTVAPPPATPVPTPKTPAGAPAVTPKISETEEKSEVKTVEEKSSSPNWLLPVTLAAGALLLMR